MEFTLWGGYGYGHGDPEEFDSLEDACRVYVARHESNGRLLGGVAYPCWGEVADDEYVIVDAFMGEGWTRAEVFAIASGEQ